MRALHPLALASSTSTDEAALRAGLRQLEESPELTWAIESLIVVAHRLSLRGHLEPAQLIIAVASESVPSLSHQTAAAKLERLAGSRQSIAGVTGARDMERSFEPIAGGTAVNQLPSIRALPRRA